MKTAAIFLLLFALIEASGQSNTLYNVRNNNSNMLLEISTLTADENGSKYVIGKNSYSNFIFKLDNNDNIVWQKEISSYQTSWDLAYFSQVEVYNNELYLLAYLHSNPLKYSLSKFDLDGNILWARILTSVDEGQYYNPSMELNANYGLIVGSSCIRSIDIFALDLDGNTKWIKNFTTDSSEIKNPNFDVLVTESGNVIGCSKAMNDMSFYCLDQNGNIKWAKRILEGENYYTRTKCILKIHENKFFICGLRATPSGGTVGDCGYSFYGLIDSTGNILDFRIINELGSNAQMKNAKLLSNGNILMQGYSSDYKLVYITIDTLNNILEGYKLLDYSYVYYFELLEGINTITENDVSIYSAFKTNIFKFSTFAGFECSNILPLMLTTTGKDPGVSPIDNAVTFHAPGSIEVDTSLSVTNSNLQIEEGCDITDINEHVKTDLKFYPTLLSNNESIFVDYETDESLQYQIMDLNGKMMSSHQLLDNSITINELSSGMYLLRLISNGKVVATTKFVVTP